MEQTHIDFNQQPKLPSVNNHLRRDILYQGRSIMLVISGISFLMACVVTFWSVLFPNTTRTVSETISSVANRGPIPTPVLASNVPLIGIVSGHAGYDPGAVCDDGLTEVELNRTIALEVIALLQRRGIQTDLLEEFDPRLQDYRADALISIHADSCNIPDATGFKVARVTLSAIPEAEDALVNCLIQEYGTATQLPEHPSSITDGMTNYHAFREIASDTPGAIIETGFMLEDRFLLQYRPKVVARGIASGIICFLETAP